MQKFSEAPLVECPKCHKDALHKCISLPSFQLKGTGWYETDFKDKKKTEVKKENSESKTDAKASVDKKDSSKEKTEKN